MKILASNADVAKNRGDGDDNICNNTVTVTDSSLLLPTDTSAIHENDVINQSDITAEVASNVCLYSSQLRKITHCQCP